MDAHGNRFRLDLRIASFLMLASALVLAACGGSSGGSNSSSGGVRATATPTQTPTATPTILPIPPLALRSVATGFNSPVALEMPNDGTNRFFVVEQAGTIKIFQNGAVGAQNFLDITSEVLSGGELGLLGVTFHPNFSANGRFFVNYTRSISGGQIQTVISEFRISTNPDVADPTTERILLTVDQPFENHKAGQLAFGNDGFLYFGLGDGGSEGDPLGNGQNLQTLLGKMLRIDVDHTDPGLQYAIPPSNPFATSTAALHEIFAYGFRNPWRFSFDRATGRQFIGDVGQESFEEVDIAQSGGNFGWNIMEGDHCYNPPTGCNMTGLIPPITEYDHSQGIAVAVIGGYVYKGSAIPALDNLYLFGDLGTGRVWYLREGPPGTFTQTLLLTNGPVRLSSFGQDTAGEIYLLNLDAGSILKLVPQ